MKKNKIKKVLAIIVVAMIISATVAIPCFAYGAYASDDDFIYPREIVVPDIPFNHALQKTGFNSYWVFPNVLQCTSNYLGGVTVGAPEGVNTWTFANDIGTSVSNVGFEPYEVKFGEEYYLTDTYAVDFVFPMREELQGDVIKYYYTCNGIAGVTSYGVRVVAYLTDLGNGGDQVVSAEFYGSGGSGTGQFAVTTHIYLTDLYDALANKFTDGDFESAWCDWLFIQPIYRDGTGVHTHFGWHPPRTSILATTSTSFLGADDYLDTLEHRFGVGSYYNGYNDGYNAGFDHGYTAGLHARPELEDLDFGKFIQVSVESFLKTDLFPVPWFNGGQAWVNIGTLLGFVVTIALIPVIIKLIGG